MFAQSIPASPPTETSSVRLATVGASREETVAHWERASGQSARDLPYYDVFAAWRMAYVMARIGTVFIERGWVPAESEMDIRNGGAAFDVHDTDRAGDPRAGGPGGVLVADLPRWKPVGEVVEDLQADRRREELPAFQLVEDLRDIAVGVDLDPQQGVLEKGLAGCELRVLSRSRSGPQVEARKAQ